ncbi:MAG: hypothetical protein U1C46_05695 [Bacteroidales bacterium]|nr:hypothetical protein [Bacteroidales bacterium]MDZ4204295.1 hypothetical protein [Bacteroidales bacterium]
MNIIFRVIPKTFLSICLLYGAILPAQTESPPLRLELEARPNTEPYNLVPYGKEGFVLFTQTNEFEDRNNRIWLVSFFDNTLKEKWTKTLAVPRSMVYRAHSAGSQHAVGLFYDEKTSQGNKYFFVVTTTDSASLRTIEGNLTQRSELVAFAQYGSWLYLGLSSRNSANVFRIHRLSGETQELKLNPDGGGHIEGISADSSLQEMVVLTSFRNVRVRTPLFMQRFNDAGQLTGYEQVMKPDNRRIISSAEYVSLNGQGWMIAGSYSTSSMRRLSASIAADGIKSAGFYQVIGSNLRQPEITYHSFSGFGNLENYLRGPVAETMHRRLKRKQDRGKTIQLEHNLVIHKIRKYKGVYLLCAEAFAPDYRTVTTITYDYYGRPIPRTYSVFDGYRYSHAVVAAMNDQGQLAWNSGIEMLNVRSFDLDFKTSLYSDGEELVLAFNQEGKIAWKPIQPKGSTENISYASIESSHTKDRVATEQKSQLSYWYDNVFLAYGYQSIVNNYHPTQQRRNVFYINKIVFD